MRPEVHLTARLGGVPPAGGDRARPAPPAKTAQEKRCPDPADADPDADLLVQLLAGVEIATAKQRRGFWMDPRDLCL